ncbi:MAG: helix-turn-helix domain-containing protein [Gluconacetobacter sp.]
MASDQVNKRLPAVMDTKEAAEYMGISYGRLRNLIWMGLGPRSFSYGKRDRRFRVSDIDDYIAAKVGDVPVVARPRGRPRKGATFIATFFMLGAVAAVLWVLRAIGILSP